MIKEVVKEEKSAEMRFSMKFFHLSDLHFGKQLHGYDLYNEQHGFIVQLCKYLKSEKPDAVLVSGDIYDKTVPAGSAVSLLDEFLMALEDITVLIIAGNHDSAERLRYGKSFLEKHNIHISVLPPQEDGIKLEKVVLQDKYGDVNFYMLPFLKSGMVRHFMPDEAAQGEQAVIAKLLACEDIDYLGRNVILSHQFYINGNAAPVRCDSELRPVSIGGTDAIDISVLKGFDYAALGHIHSAQYIGEEKFRYCGTPLKYSVSEACQNKSITVVSIGAKKDGVHISTLPIKVACDVIKLRGSLKEVIAASNERNKRNYASITLTDDDIPDMVKEQLEPYFENILEVIVDNKRTRQIFNECEADFKELTPYEAFGAFFKEVSGRTMDELEDKLIKEIINEVAEMR